LQINNELLDGSVITLNADLNQAEPVSGPKIPLADIVLTVRKTASAGTYSAAGKLSGLYQLKPYADAANILVDAPSHSDFQGTSSDSVALVVKDPQVSGVLLSLAQSPLFDLASFQGTLFL
jgi:hypothetical protein